MNSYTLGEITYSFGIEKDVFVITVINKMLVKKYTLTIESNDIFIHHPIIQNINILEKVLCDGFRTIVDVFKMTQNISLKFESNELFEPTTYNITVSVDAIYVKDSIELKLSKVDEYIPPTQVIEHIARGSERQIPKVIVRCKDMEVSKLINSSMNIPVYDWGRIIYGILPERMDNACRIETIMSIIPPADHFGYNVLLHRVISNIIYEMCVAIISGRINAYKPPAGFLGLKRVVQEIYCGKLPLERLRDQCIEVYTYIKPTRLPKMHASYSYGTYNEQPIKNIKQYCGTHKTTFGCVKKHNNYKF